MSLQSKTSELDSFRIAPTQVLAQEAFESLSLSPGLIGEDLLQILEQRFVDAQRCLEHSPLATIMLCGSLLEGLLLGLAQKRAKEFNQAKQSPKNKENKTKSFNEWTLAEFINVAHGLGILRGDVAGFGHALRDFRNYIHPYEQLKASFNPDQHTAEMCLLAVKAAVHGIRDFTKLSSVIISGDWANHPNATQLALLCLIGTWDENNEADKKAVASMLCMSYDEWFKLAREIVQLPSSPLVVKGGVWRIKNKKEFFEILTSRIHDQDLDNFKTLAIEVLKENDPTFELKSEERYAASLHSKVMSYSSVIREGVSEGLALLTCYQGACTHSTQGKPRGTVERVIYDVLLQADWVLWGSLNSLLPTLAEATPNIFIERVEQALRTQPSPFHELYAQEGNAITGSNYMVGLLWALETLAWDEQYLVRVCVVLAELASIDPGGQYANRPGNSLADILLPWRPHTLASVDKRKVAVINILREFPYEGWKLLLELLPDQRRTTSGTHQPKWCNIVACDQDSEISTNEYRQQVEAYAELAVKTAGFNIDRLKSLIKISSSLTKLAFEKLLAALSSNDIKQLTEDQRYPLWRELTRVTRKHRKYQDTEWALPSGLLDAIDGVAEELQPVRLSLLHQELFMGYGSDFYDVDSDFETQEKLLATRRAEALSEIFETEGLDVCFELASKVNDPRNVGYALALIEDKSIGERLLPFYLITENLKQRELLQGFVWRKFYLHGWEWCGSLDIDHWSKEQKGQFLAYLPFTSEVWGKVSEWLGNDEELYWLIVEVNPYFSKDDLSFVIDKLVKYERFHVAAECFSAALHHQQDINVKKLAQVLLALVSSEQSARQLDTYRITELIKYLQEDLSTPEDDLFQIEWAYLPLLMDYNQATPKLLESKLASDPEFFCEVVRLVFHSKNEKRTDVALTEEKQAIASNAWHLLHYWRTVPGVSVDDAFDVTLFKSWLAGVIRSTTESGHLDVAMRQVGQVLIHAPVDPGGLWIHESVAEALNARDAEAMRSSFSIGVHNSRGAHTVDPTGKPERELADKYRQQAEDVENAGFSRFAATLKELVNDYDNQAERNISRYGPIEE